MMNEKASRFPVSRRGSFEFIGLAGLFAFGLTTSRLFSHAAYAEDVTGFDKERMRAEILQAIKNELEKHGLDGITGIGPLSEDGKTCLVLVTEQKQREKLPEKIEIGLSNQPSALVDLKIEVDMVPSTLFNGFNRVDQHAGPMMGGDPIWNNASSGYGTIAFAVANGSMIKIEGNACANQCVSCNHVLYHAAGNIISTPNYPDSMTLKWSHPPSGSKWVDLAGAELNMGIAAKALEVRGLGTISGAVQPTTGIRVMKYGATTGLTVGKDLGPVWRAPDPTKPNDKYWFRTVSGLFSEIGDSGAAVLNTERRLAGMIVAGKTGVPNEKWYMPVLPAGETPVDANLSYFTIESL